MAAIESAELPNGTRVALLQMPQLHSVSVGIWSGVGSRHELLNTNGISHFLEHMLFRGTSRRSSCRIVSEIESRGGYINAFTSEDHTCYYAKVESSHARSAVDVLIDMYCHASLKPSDTEQERAIILEEIRGYLDNPATRVEELLDEALWPGHILGLPVTGSEASLNRISNKQLVQHRDRHYNSSNTIITVAGNFPDALGQLVDEKVQSLRTGDRPRSKTRLPAQKKQTRIECSDTEQCHVELGFRTFGRRHRGRYTLRIISILLGENMSSTLFQKLREKHALCYHLQSEISLLDETGALTIQLALDARNLSRALDMIQRECEILATRGVAQSRLNAARRFALGQMRMSRDSVTQRMMYLGESLLGYDRVIPDQQTEQGFMHVSTADIRRVAGKIYRMDRAAIAVVCHHDDESLIRKTVQSVI